MLSDLLSIAAPEGRTHTRFLDFGLVPTGTPQRLELRCFNVGGGVLDGEVSTDCPWLEVNASGLAAVQATRFHRNRQTVTVTALPDRIPTRGIAVEGRLRVRLPTNEVVVTCRLERCGGFVQVTPSSSLVRLQERRNGWVEGHVVFRNTGERSVTLRWAVPGLEASVEPACASLDEGAEIGVTVAIERRLIPEGARRLSLAWEVNGQSQVPLKLEVAACGRFGWRIPLPLLRPAR
jgi:hypothetical protein